jgi:hypothetical protein
MPRSKEFLLEQIARARRFAADMNSEADRERFERWRRTIDANWTPPKRRARSGGPIVCLSERIWRPGSD